MSAPHLQIAWKSNVDLYADLELHHTATHEDVKKSYKRLALKHHPDKQNPGQAIDTAPFMKVRDAYEILSNEESRRKYDLWDSYQYRGPPRETRQRGSTERRRRRRQEQYSQHRADTAFVRLETILERMRAENAAREHAEKFRQSEERSKSAIRRRQKEAERMARLRLQQQEQAEAEQRHLDQDQTQYGARETFERSIDDDQRASARAPVDLKTVGAC
ncbi:hypothetical protein N0V93_008404 [Gnomoniopsis smithogilvyi]|uniref:J domain-containing protein n=1 Tax=Gnomoniopsis smithogilvyi TaxID=1191159 RepID=A0A9W8YLX5_9PEZI|nr:hypothetical protein N0V93_008404 [Gnomoniopsis smithogilvyi]